MKVSNLNSINYLREIVDTILEDKNYDNNQNLIEWGLDSLAIMKLLVELKKQGISITFAQLIKSPTIESWVNLIEDNLNFKEKTASSEEINLNLGDKFELTDVQYAYWVGRDDSQELGGNSCHAYIEFDIDKIDVEKLSNAWEKVKNRHGMLRAYFSNDAMQRVEKVSGCKPLLIHDLRKYSKEQCESILSEMREKTSHRKLDIENGCVAELQLTLMPNSCRIHFDIDLLVADVKSINIVLDDLCKAYQGEEIDGNSDWIFGNYLKRKNIEEREKAKESEKYWKERLFKLPLAPALPLKKHTKDIVSPKFFRRSCFISKKQWDSIKLKASINHITPAMVLLTAYSIILDRWSENDSFLINIPLFERYEYNESLDREVADFTNLLLLDININKFNDFKTLCVLIQKHFYEVLENSGYSGVNVQRDLKHLHGECAIAPVVFAYNIGMNIVSDRFIKEFGNIEYMISQTPQIWLDFQIYECDGGIKFCWDSVDEIFPKGLVDDMFFTFEGLIKDIAEKNWEEIDYNFYVERIRKARHIEPDEKSRKLLQSGFLESVRKYPDKIAIVDDYKNESISYKDLKFKVDSIATYIRKIGIAEGEIIAIQLPRSIEQICAVLGILQAGCAYLPIHIEQPFSRKNKILEESNVSNVICNKITAKFDDNINILDIDEALSCAHVEFKNKTYDTDTAYVIFTSGSSGTPKGVVITHKNALNTINEIMRITEMDPSSVLLAVSSYDFDLSVFDIFSTFSAGGELILLNEFNCKEPKTWISLINKYNVTLWNSVPALLEMILYFSEREEIILKSIKNVLISGDWINIDLPKKLLSVAKNAKFHALGGATEASIWSNIYTFSDELDNTWNSMPYGFPLKNQSYRVLDTKGRDCPDWVTGELVIGGRGVAKGYINNPQKTTKQFIYSENELRYHTGDLGRYRPDGTLEFLGRKDSQVKIRGYRIELGEIENIIKRVEGIEDVVVTVSNEDKKIYALVVLKKGLLKEMIIDTILKKISDNLPSYMIPDSIIEVPVLPLNKNGKVMRNKAEEIINSKKIKENSREILSKRGTENELMKIWKSVLQVEEISISDDYFRMGGDSLNAVKLINLIKDFFGIELTLASIFNMPTIREQAILIDSSSEKYPKDKWFNCIDISVEKKDTDFSMTELQKAYVIGRSGAYLLGNIGSQFYIELEIEDINYEKLCRSFQKLINEHDMMRAIASKNGLKQFVKPEVEDYNIKCFTEYSNIDYEKQLIKVRNEMLNNKFDLFSWPLFKIQVVRNNISNIARVHCCFDSIMFDAWSVLLILRQWKELYEDKIETIPKNELKFKDYILTLEKIKKSDEYSKDEIYWESKLSSMPPAPELPIEKQPSEIDTPVFSHYEHIIDAEKFNKLKEISKSMGVTVSTVILTLYSEILGYWSRHQSFTINLTRFNRLPLHPKVNELVGDFTSITLLAVDLKNGKSFIERCKQIQKQLWENMDHPYMCGVQLQRELIRNGNEKFQNGMPIVFTSSLGLEDITNGKSPWFGKRKYSSSQTPQVWLDHQLLTEDGNLVVIWDVVEELFPKGMIEEMFSAYITTIDEIIGDISIWNKNKKSVVVLKEFLARDIANSTDANLCCRESTLISMVLDKAFETPYAKAIITEDKTISYKELITRSYSLAEKINNMDSGSIVAVAMEKGWQQVIAVIGIMMSGRAYLPISLPFPKDRCKIILEKCNIDTVVTQEKYVDLEEHFSGTTILTVNSDRNEDLIDFSKDIKPEYFCKLKHDDLAYIIYTSGSTGMPKGVMITHEAVVNTICDINDRFKIKETDRILGISDLSFDLSVYDIFGALSAGAALVIPNSENKTDVHHWIELIDKYNISIWNSVPALMKLMIDSITDWSNIITLESIRLILLSGDWIPVNLPEKIKKIIPNTRIISLGGATEASIWSVCYEIGDINKMWKSIPYGKALRNQKMYVFNDLMLEPPALVPGKLFIGGIGLSSGYWKEPLLNAKKYVLHPVTNERIYDTGDIARYCPDGNIEFLGREDYQVKLNGYRIELNEISSIISSYEHVREAIVDVAKKNSTQRLIAFVVKEKVRKYVDIKLQEKIDLLSKKYEAQLRKYSKEYSEIIDYKNNNSLKRIMTTLNKLNFFNTVGEIYSINEILDNANILSKYYDLIKLWLDILVSEKYLVNDGNNYKSIKSFMEINSFADINSIESIIKILTEENAIIDFVLKKGEVFKDMLDFSDLYSINREIFKYIIDCIDSIKLEKIDKISILEYETRNQPIVEFLSENLNHEFEYFYIHGAKEIDALKENLYYKKNINFLKTDTALERNMDVILANSRLHREKNIDLFLSQIKKRLKLGGLLIFVEPIVNNYFITSSVAFLEDGFSKFEDERKTTCLPMFSENDWNEHLEKNGFSILNKLFKEKVILERFGVQVFVAQLIEDNTSVSEEELINFLRNRLPEYMIPKSYIFIDEIPLSTNGKIDRKKLLALHQESVENKDVVSDVPKNDLEYEIYNIWKSIFEVEKLSIYSNFFDLGGDSLMMINAIEKIEKSLNIKLSMKEFYSNPSIFKLSEHIARNLKIQDDIVLGEI